MRDKLVKNNLAMNIYLLYSSNKMQEIFSKINFFKETTLEEAFVTIVEDKYIIEHNLDYTKTNCIVFTEHRNELHIKDTVIVKEKERMVKIIDYFTFFFSLKHVFDLNLILLKLGFKPGNKSFNYILYFGYRYYNRKINDNTKIKNIYAEIALFFNVSVESVAKAINRDFINVNLDTDFKNMDLSRAENYIYNFVILNKSVKAFLFSLLNYYLSKYK